MICENCGIETENFICPNCGVLLVDLFSNNPNSDLNNFSYSMEANAVFEQLRPLDFYMPSGNRIDVNKKVKKSLNDNIIKPEEERVEAQEEEKRRIEEEKRKAEEERRRAEEQKAIDEEVLAGLTDSLNKGEPLDIEFIYNFRKRFKSFKLQDVPGYDFTEKAKAAIPEKLKNNYRIVGDYIMYAGMSYGCPIVVTDKRLYLDNIVYNICDLQGGCMYQGLLGALSQIPDDMCLVELSGLQSSTYIMIPKAEEPMNVVTCVMAAALPNRKPWYRAIEDRSDEKVYICLNCHTKDVKPGILKSVCPVCGKISQSAVGVCVPANVKKSLNSYEELLEDNYSTNKDISYFRDDEYWYDCATKIRDSLPEDVKQRIMNTGVSENYYNNVIEDNYKTIDNNSETIKSPNMSQSRVSDTQVALRKCPSCGKMIHADAEFCNYCGAKIEAQQQDDTMFCVHCGQKISKHDKFCSHCGQANKYWEG